MSDWAFSRSEAIDGGFGAGLLCAEVSVAFDATFFLVLVRPINFCKMSSKGSVNGSIFFDTTSRVTRDYLSENFFGSFVANNHPPLTSIIVFYVRIQCSGSRAS